jgi:outer membrane lipoprotein-sorting protein
MRRFFLALFAGFGILALAVSAGGYAVGNFTRAQRADLDRISAALNAIHTMKGTFTQIDSNGGIAQGMFFVEKPGKMRFQYSPPVRMLVVADGHTVAVRNGKLNTTDRYPLGNSPLNFVLSNDLDLKSNPMIIGVEHQNGSLIVRAHASHNEMNGSITMVFTDPGLELRQWTIFDAQGQETTVSLADVQTGTDIPGSAFVLKDDAKFSKNKQD